MSHILARAALALTTTTAAAALGTLPAASAAPQPDTSPTAKPAVAPDSTAQGVVTARGGLVGHLRPSTHAPANFTFPDRSRITIDCKVPGTRVGGNAWWYLVVAEGDANWVTARYVRNVGRAPDHCDPSDGFYSAKATTALKKRVGPSTADFSAGTYAAKQKFKVQCFTDGGQKWFLTDQGRWVYARYVATSSKVRYCSNL